MTTAGRGISSKTVRKSTHMWTCYLLSYKEYTIFFIYFFFWIVGLWRQAGQV